MSNNGCKLMEIEHRFLPSAGVVLEIGQKVGCVHATVGNATFVTTVYVLRVTCDLLLVEKYPI